MTAPWVELTAAVLSGVPKLPGALCAGRSELFDGDTDDATARAAELCRRCPARDPCGAWAETLAHNRAHGVLAGQRREWGQPP
ncbi:WhiB family transcriptional regulator [Mycobacterium camsae]|uniref:WhiB family transcriptional regulator n=1 Tax=Mycobacterium gordonae TaxID=1778 RepID=UPI00197D642B|nr:WhiB family transcriptional regulator [Mycobacterium gordonae]